ncbi:MAG: histidinol-phosphatase [Rhodobacteraceae bacterium]|nr:MAG: histidinol-phosphatase [Paracoccaceae bacterium]
MDGDTRDDGDAALLAAAHAAADAARAPCLERFRQSTLAADDKAEASGRFDPVTAADRAAEIAMRAVLARLRPGDAVMGEEHAPTPGDTGFTWVLDPIDGTRSYMSGAPTWGVLVALNDGVRPVIGLIDQPFTGERFEGLVRGGRATASWTRGAEKRALRTRPCAALSDATLFTTYPEVGTAAEQAGFNAVRDHVRLTRYGLDCYAYALLAMGCVDLVIEAGLQPYDVQALIPVIEGAGGVITGWRGEDCQQGGRVVAAGDAALHAAALEILSRV